MKDFNTMAEMGVMYNKDGLLTNKYGETFKVVKGIRRDHGVYVDEKDMHVIDFESSYPTKRCLNTIYGSAAMKSAYPLVVRLVVTVDFESAYPRIFN